MEKNQIIELKIEDMLDDGRAFGRCDGCAVFVSTGPAVAGNGAGGRSLPDLRSAIPGDLVKVRIIKEKRSSAEAELLAVTEPSADRMPAECPYFGECGGCALQEMSYEAQKKLKKRQLEAKLSRLGGIEAPKVNECIGAETLKYYRNKAVFAVGPHGEVGFKKAKSHFVMDIDDCMLQSDAAMVCADALRTFLKGRNSDPVITGMTVKTAFGTGEVMAVLETESRDNRGKQKRGRDINNKKRGESKDAFNIPDIETLVKMLDDAVYSLNAAAETDAEDGAVTLSEAEDNTEARTRTWSLESVAVINGNKCHIIAGKPAITEEVITADGGSVMFEISPQSFFQVNPEQMVKLYDKASEYAGLDGSAAEDYLPELLADSDRRFTVLDLYCGAGTIGIWLLEKLRNKAPELFEKSRVIGIESVKPAVIDANRNSVINGLVNTRYICGKAEEELPGMMGLAKLYKWNEVNERVEREPEIRIGHADVAILDPPRAGCGEALLEAVVKAEPDRIVYVSCDPGTLARDIRYLAANGYEFIEATPVDQFPWTTSTEICSILKRKES